MELLLQGSRGAAVRNVQHALNYHLPGSMPALVEDGIYGSRTKARVLEFQTRFGLRKKEGIVGPETHKALYCFVALSHHLLMPRFTLRRPSFAIRAGLTGDDEPILPNMPPLPPLKLPFPAPLRTPLPVPQLTLDPETVSAMRQIKFELEVGKERKFEKDLGQSDPLKAETQLFTDLKATAWSRPFNFLGKEDGVDFSAGGGLLLEKRVRPEGGATEASVYVFVKAEWTPIDKLGPLQLAKIAGEAKITSKVNGKEPIDFSAAVTVGPEVEVAGGAITFGPGAYVEYKTTIRTHSIAAGLTLSGAYHF